MQQQSSLIFCSLTQYCRFIQETYQDKMSHHDSQPSSSFMQNDQSQPGPQNTKKESQQFKALFLKNLRLQSKQKGTNICQILTPILCILFTFLMKSVAEQNLTVGAIFEPVYYPVKYDNLTYFDKINNNTRNKLQWMMYACEQQCDATILGSNTGDGPKNGLLGMVEETFTSTIGYRPDPANLSHMVPKRVPFFLDKFSTQINETMDNELYNRLQKLNTLNFTQIRKFGGFDFIPDGTYNISLLNESHLKFDIKVKDVRELDMHRPNAISMIAMNRTKKGSDVTINKGEIQPYAGMLYITHWITESFIKLATGKSVGSGSFFMPEDESGVSFIDTLINLIAILIFPVSLSLLFPVFLYTVVLEKEEKLIQMMKMNGMKISSYWLVYFIFNFVLSLLTNIIFVFFGVVLTRMRFFLETSPLLIAIVLIGWSLAQIGMAVFFQTFLNKSRSANIIGYLISIWTSMIGSTLCIGVYQYPNELPMGARFFAPFAFTRIIYLMLSGCSEGKCYGSVSHIPTEMQHEIALLYMNFIFFFIVGAYLFQIVPQEFGVTRNVLFPFSMFKKFIKGKVSKDEKLSDNEIDQDYELDQYMNKSDEDNFVKKERSDLLTDKNVIKQNPLVINNLRKLYYKEGMKKIYAAVKSFNLKVGPKQTFGLLGPNGAGKTTLISMITGMFEPNYGNAWIGGYDIRTSVQKAQLQMGVCPQFDLLWPQLTVSEHLYFYGRLKGIPSKEMDKKVDEAIEQVKLTNFKDFPSSSLSGGMKRRLSVAISLVGDPKIVFLDEPSTGLDPENRRQLWEVLAKCQKNRAIFITTHMMEEADALCNRVGIITKGVLRTVAPQVTLKKVYGGGYRVSISVTREERKLVDRNSLHTLQKGNKIEDYHPNEQQEQEDIRRSINSFIETQEQQKKQKSDRRVSRIMKFMDEYFPGSVLLKQYNGYLIFKVLPKYKVSEIFQIVQKMEKELEIVDVAITNSSLEDVFMNVVKQHEKDEPGSEIEGEGGNRDGEKEKTEQVFMSFPNEQSKLNSVNPNLNQTPGSSQEMKNPVGSSVISKNRSSVMSHNKPAPANHIESVEQSMPDASDIPADKKKKLKKEDDDGEDYF